MYAFAKDFSNICCTVFYAFITNQVNYAFFKILRFLLQKSIKIFVNFYLTYIEVPLTIRQYSMFDVYIDFLKESTII